MEVLFEDKELLIINKPGGLSAQPSKKDDNSVLSKLENLGHGHVFITHRLDQRATGAMILAKSKEAQAEINEQFRKGSILKKYWAMVKNKPKQKEGTLIHYLLKNGKTNRSKAYDKEVAHSKRAELDYQIINQSDHYFLLEILLKTGRHHQIRAQLAAIGSPIKGDVKYGFKRTNASNFIHLHARKIQLIHPFSNQKISVFAPPPEDPLWSFMLNNS